MLEYETFEEDPTDKLLDMADIFRACVAAVNGSSNVDCSRVALPSNSNTVMSTGPDGLMRFNFSKAAVIENLLPWVLEGMEDMHTVADEIRLRLAKLPRPGLHACMLAEMERETNKCLDIQFGRPAVGLDDLLTLARP